MTLMFTRPEFERCPSCAAKPGSPELCRECLERRELHGVVMSFQKVRIFSFSEFHICKVCNGWPKIECKEHGR